MLLQIRPLLSAPALISGQNEYSQTHTCIHTFAMGKHVHQMLLQVRPLLSAPALICGQNEYSRTHTCIHTFAIGKSKLIKCRVGQDHICTVYIRYLWQGNHQIYGHIRCINTVLTNPTNERCERRAPSRGSCRGTACEG